MTIVLSDDRSGFEVECDTCRDLADETFDSFSAAIWWIRSSNWLAETDDDGETWTHRCPECIKPEGKRLEKAREMFGIVKD